MFCWREMKYTYATFKPISAQFCTFNTYGMPWFNIYWDAVINNAIQIGVYRVLDTHWLWYAAGDIA